MNARHSIVMMAVAALCAASAVAQHDHDVVLAMDDEWTIITGVMEDRVFEPARLWIEDIDSFVTDDPGYDAPTGTFSANSSAGLAIRKALRVWNDDEGHFMTIAPQPMTLSHFSLMAQTPDEDPASFAEFPLLGLGHASAAGALHVHPLYFLPFDASDGMYLLELEFWINPGLMPVFIRSEPFWIIFTLNEDDEEAIEEAAAWVFANLIDLATCPADLNGDGVVDVFDLLALLGDWGMCPGEGAACPADLNGDGAVDVFDLLALLEDWGPCPE